MNPIDLATRFFSSLLLRLNPIRSAQAVPHVGPLTLRDLAPGHHGRVTGFDLPEEKFHRILEMGVTTGTRLQVVRLAPLGDPIEIKVRGYHLSLRKDEAAGIHIETESVS
jgi:Fe2+ transport system protein FeoA